MAKKSWNKNSVILVVTLAILGIIAIVSIFWVVSTWQIVITGNVLNTVSCSQTCASPAAYKQWNAANQQSCIANCCASKCASPTSYAQFGATNQQDCVKKCSALPATTSGGIILVRRLKQVSSIL